MQYTDTAGQPVQGDVWSPGPMPATVWVLVPGGGQAVVHVSTRREVPEDRWLGRAGSASSNGPTLSAKLWREALGFDPRAVVRGEAEQPELVTGLEPVTEPDPIPVPDAVPATAEVAAQLQPEVEPEPEPALPVGTAVRIDVDTAGRDARVIGAKLEDGRVKLRCEDTIGTVWLLDPEQVAELEPVTEPAATEPEPVTVTDEPVPAPRIDYRRPAGAYRKRGAAYRKVVAQAEVPAGRPRIDYRKPVARACADPRCVDGLTRCEGCNGYGVLTAGGRRYRLASGGRNIGATAVRHDRCAGTGLAVCSCGRVATGSPVREPATS